MTVHYAFFIIVRRSYVTESTQTVLECHLAALGKSVDALMQDYSADSVLISKDATYRGIDEIQ
jgi:hypothetical protein